MSDKLREQIEGLDYYVLDGERMVILKDVLALLPEPRTPDGWVSGQTLGLLKSGAVGDSVWPHEADHARVPVWIGEQPPAATQTDLNGSASREQPLIGEVRGLERAADLVMLYAERLKHTSHRDGLGMGWQDGEHLCGELATMILGHAATERPAGESAPAEPLDPQNSAHRSTGTQRATDYSAAPAVPASAPEPTTAQLVGEARRKVANFRDAVSMDEWPEESDKPVRVTPERARWFCDSIDALADRLESQATEVERLTACLATANANHEEYERRYYLEVGKMEDAAERIAELEAEVQAYRPMPFVNGAVSRESTARRALADTPATETQG